MKKISNFLLLTAVFFSATIFDLSPILIMNAFAEDIDGTCTCCDSTTGSSGVTQTACESLCSPGGVESFGGTSMDCSATAPAAAPAPEPTGPYCLCCDDTQITSESVADPAECNDLCSGNGGGKSFSDGASVDPVSDCGVPGSAAGTTPVSRPAGPLIGFANPLCPSSDTPCDIESILGRVIKVALGIAGSVALAMFVFGGFVWMTARGEQKKIQLATDVLKWSGIGLVVIFASYIMVKFILEQVI